MEQANTDRPKARSTRKGKPPETSSEDSYNADRGEHTGQWTLAELQRVLQHTVLPPPQAFPEQH